MEQTSPIQALLQQRTLLQLEYYTEKEAFRKLTEQIGMRRKVKRGDAWFPLRIGKSFYNSLNQKSIEVFRTSDEEIDHNFEFGRPVMFFQVKNHPGEISSHASSQNAASSSQGAMSSSQNAASSSQGAMSSSQNAASSSQGAASSSSASNPKSIKYFSFTGTVSYVDGDRMVINVPDSVSLLDLQTEEPIGVQLSFDETSYKLMFEALDRTMKAKNNRLAYLRDLFYSHQKAGRFSFEPMKFPWLNPTQERAVNEVLWAKDVAIVHGPPGTGKTTTLVEAINETLMRESQVLVCAQSNMAVDWISEKLVDRGINVLRIGNPTRVNDKMLGFTYERRFENHPDYPQLWAIRKAIRELRSNRKKGSESFHQKMDRLRSRAAEIEIRINAELFGEARVIACTLVGSAHRLLEGMKFGTLFIDEAAQALEAACWIPMRRASRVILAGDHCQLPPTVKSIAALRAGLGKTLMERIAENKPEVVTLLKIQYRMNEDIMRFSSDWFYGGQVESAPQIKYRSILDFDHPITWIDTSNEENQMTIEGEDAPEDSASTSSSSSAANQNSDLNFKEQFVGESFGRINKAEAELTLLTLAEYFTKIGKQRVLGDSIDVGIISPYRAQVQYLKKLIKKYEFFKPYRRLISVNTVDGFQGQERDVILISLVRSNDEGQIGFLKDLRRMNVAMTRARMKLIILGNKDTMTKHPFYKKLWEYVEGLNNDE